MKTYCSKSWTDVNIDLKNRLIRHCCKAKPYTFPDTLTANFIDNSVYIQKRRYDTLNDIKHSDCFSCWDDYAKYNSAYRDWMNTWNDADFSSAQINVPQVHYIELELDNTCDLSCLYCSGICSSKIAQENGEVHSNTIRPEDLATVKIWIESTIAKTNGDLIIIFLGGEPTASKLFYELIEFIQQCALINKECAIRLSICTNCNSAEYLMNKVLSAIDNTSITWNIAISNENSSDTASLIRYGLNWKRFESNFIRYITHPNVNSINMAPTLNALSLPDFAKYMQWVHNTHAAYAPDKQISWTGNYVSWPQPLDIANLPTKFNSYIHGAITVANSYKQALTDVNYQKLITFLNRMLDRIGTTYTVDYLENLQEFLNESQRLKNTTTLMQLLEKLK